MSFKDALNNSLSQLVELEGSARALRNQNLADQIGHAIGRLKMACSHPDIDNVDRVKDGHKELAPAGEPLNSGGNMVFSAGDPGRILQDQEAARRASFPDPALQGGPVDAQGFPLQNADPNAPGYTPAAPFPVAGAAAGEPVTNHGPDAKYPGDPQFQPEANNAGFKNPNDVALNENGTLKSAPNSLGAAHDDRDKK